MSNVNAQMLKELKMKKGDIVEILEFSDPTVLVGCGIYIERDLRTGLFIFLKLFDFTRGDKDILSEFGSQRLGRIIGAFEETYE